MAFTIPNIRPLAEDNHKLARLLQSKIKHKAKPTGGLGKLETLALQLGLIQRSDVISLQQPQLMIFAGDHGIAQDKISTYASDASMTMARHILEGGSASTVLARQHGIELKLIDAGLTSDLPDHPLLVKKKWGKGTVNFSLAPAMTASQCDGALQAGYDLAVTAPGNVLAVGEIGSGNTASASMLLAKLSNVTIAEATARNLPDEDTMMLTKRALLLEATLKFRRVNAPLEVLQHFGGFETAMMVGAMLGAASQRRLVLADGFCACAAALVARQLSPASVDYMVFAHSNGEPRHRHMLGALGAEPLLELGLRMGEGIGALLAWPLVLSAGKILNEMHSDGSPPGAG